MVTLRAGRCLGQAAVLGQSEGDGKQVGEFTDNMSNRRTLPRCFVMEYGILERQNRPR